MDSTEKKRILIVEDDKPIATALQLKLQTDGFEVKVASDGKEGLTLAEKESFDLVLLDLMMPVLDGFGFLEGLKEKGLKVKTIVLSNLGQEEDILKTRALGAVDYIVKADLDLQQVVDRARKYL